MSLCLIILLFVTDIGEPTTGLVMLEGSKNGKVLCIQCDKTFCSIYNAKRHYEEQHGMVNSEVECQICHKNFKNAHSRGNHYRIVHQVSASSMKNPIVP